MTEVEEIKKEIEDLKKKVEFLQKKNDSYEENGPAKLYYSLKRKSWEMAELMNNNNLNEINIDDPKVKTFERLKFIWQDSSSLAIAIKSLEESAGITSNEKEDIGRKRSFLDKHAS